MGSLFAPKMPAPPPPPAPAPEPPSFEDEERERLAAEKQKDLMRKRKGRRSTIVTGPLGTETEAPTEKKTLLGS